MNQQTIWKVSFRLCAEIHLEMPKGAKLLHVNPPFDPLDGDISIWMLVYPDQPKVRRRLRIYGTGHSTELTEQVENYVGTVHLGMFVWHVFDRGEVRT